MRWWSMINAESTPGVTRDLSGNGNDAYATILLSEKVLRREWDTPEEDAAWAYLAGEPDGNAPPTGDLAPGQEREDDV